MLMTIILMSILHYGLVKNLWDYSYIKDVKKDWRTYPIIQLKEIADDESCSDYYMEWDQDYGYSGYYDEFEVVGRAPWWGFKKGCVCPSGSQWADVDTRQCMDEQIKAYCFDVAQQDPFTMPVVNKKQLCARRDSSYDMFSVAKPELQNGQYVCAADKKLCGGDAPIQFLFCVPEKSACPITGIQYNEAGELTEMTEPSKLPLI